MQKGKAKNIFALISRVAMSFSFQLKSTCKTSTYLYFLIFSTFQKLQQKLGLDEHDYHQVSPLRTSETASTSHSEAAHNSREHISVVDRIHEDSGGHQKSLNNDTIILVCSLVVMIIIGK